MLDSFLVEGHNSGLFCPEGRSHPVQLVSVHIDFEQLYDVGSLEYDTFWQFWINIFFQFCIEISSCYIPNYSVELVL